MARVSSRGISPPLNGLKGDIPLNLNFLEKNYLVLKI
jgi:hypothetical protein